MRKLKKLEVRASRRRQPAGYGYVGMEEVSVQQLGYTDLRGWVPVDEEIVPHDVKISIGALGSYDGPWRSKFLNWIPKARGGNAEDFT